MGEDKGLRPGVALRQRHRYRGRDKIDLFFGFVVPPDFPGLFLVLFLL